MNLHHIFLREHIIQTVRTLLRADGFMEVTLPLLRASIPLEPSIYPFTTTWHAHNTERKFWLSTSPEAGLKKLLAEGWGNLFSISKAFRDNEADSPSHYPEFLMVEWYRRGAVYTDIIGDVERLIRTLKKTVDAYVRRKHTDELTYGHHAITIPPQWTHYTMRQLWQNYLHVDLMDLMEDGPMESFAQDRGYQADRTTWEQVFHQIFLNEIEPKLGLNPCIVKDYPSRISPLCATNMEDPHFAQRFEIYLAGMEIGNGNTENTNTDEIRESFAREKSYRTKHGLPLPETDDTSFLDSVTQLSTPTVAGVGLGLDRLAMIFADVEDIREVQPK